ncbi:MAG: NAD-dependent epimerase/dehydratase family protein [Desulfobacterales bacterium]|nr:NAD-dependent epimerase/dehydratase family protein [Desulfobacterales bacterium]
MESSKTANGIALVTGSAGLIGSESVRFLADKGFDVHGIDNDMRQRFFGREASTDWNRRALEADVRTYTHHTIDIRDTGAVEKLFKGHQFDLIIHAAAQPSHDWAATEPVTDFTVNANGTLVLLELFRTYCPEAVFIFTSTNKVYGDRPNSLPLLEKETRFELPADHRYYNGIDETLSIDDSKHSLFGVSKIAADMLVQEYGKYFDLQTVSFRGGCLTGPNHAGTRLHGFLAYLARSIATDREYTIYGYQGKQVRDNIHAHDLVQAFWSFYQNPRRGEVYNIGGGRHANISMLEAIAGFEKRLGQTGRIRYSDDHRSGDHIWYISGMDKFRSHYPEWKHTFTIEQILDDICAQGHLT